jgi:hypothetical protein
MVTLIIIINNTSHSTINQEGHLVMRGFLIITTTIKNCLFAKIISPNFNKAEKDLPVLEKLVNINIYDTV